MFENLARALKELLGRADRVLDNPPYNLVIHTSPVQDPTNDHYHWHIEFMPKLTKTAGFEWGTGFYINPTPPEEAAKFLREANVEEPRRCDRQIVEVAGNKRSKGTALGPCPFQLCRREEPIGQRLD